MSRDKTIRKYTEVTRELQNTMTAQRMKEITSYQGVSNVSCTLSWICMF